MSSAADTQGQSRASRGQWRLTGVLYVLLLAAAATLTGVFAGAGWWWLMAFVGGLVLFAGAGLRAAGVSRSLSPVFSALILIGTLTAIFGGGAGFLLVIPTPSSIARLLELAGQVVPTISTQGVPAQPVEELLFLLAAGTGLVALALELLAIALRLPAMAGIPILMVLSVPVIFLDGGINLFWLVLCIAAYAWLLRIDVRMRRFAPRGAFASISAAASVIVVALIVAVTAPGFAPDGSIPFSVSGVIVGNGVNPLIDLGKDLRRPQATTVLSYSTTSTDQAYLKLTTLDRFTGATWTHARSETKALPDDDSIGPAPGLNDSVERTKIRTRVSVGDLRSPWLPVPYPVLGVHGQTGAWTWAPRDLTIASTSASAGQQTYSATSLIVKPSEEQLRAANSFIPQSVRADLELPGSVPSIITKAAEKATKGATSEYERAVALQNYFRNSGFEYSLQTPLEQGYDGDGLAVIATFLTKKSGYCVHFASAMAVMARVLGIPARVAIGYLPGTGTATDSSGRTVYTVTSDELHSWPELYFAGVGWLAFEPTVGQGVVPSYTIPQSDPSGPAPTSTATAGASAPTPSTGSRLPDQNGSASTPGATTTDATLPALLIVLAALILALLPAGSRLIVRRRRRSRVITGELPASVAWRELRDTARDLRAPMYSTQTPRAFADHIASRLRDPNDTDALTRVRDAVEREAFDRQAPPDTDERRALVRDLDAVVAGLYRDAPTMVRFVARFSPVSLVPALPGSDGSRSAHNA